MRATKAKSLRRQAQAMTVGWSTRELILATTAHQQLVHAAYTTRATYQRLKGPPRRLIHETALRRSGRTPLTRLKDGLSTQETTMSTIDSKEIILEILQNNGVYPGDPQAFAVLSYENDWGKPTWAICMNQNSFAETMFSPFVHNPVVLWSQASGLTADGEQLLSSKENPQ